jgi:hypothetical protein
MRKRNEPATEIGDDDDGIEAEDRIGVILELVRGLTDRVAHLEAVLELERATSSATKWDAPPTSSPAEKPPGLGTELCTAWNLDPARVHRITVDVTPASSRVLIDLADAIAESGRVLARYRLERNDG